jgi:putative hemolysin
VRFSYSRPEQPWLNRTVIRIIERISGQPRLEGLYRDWAANPRLGENLFGGGLRMMNISIDTDTARWERVPKTGPVLFIANHPFGVVDGLLMGHLATVVRPDTKIMTHSLLCQAPEARDHVLPVDFGGTPEAQQTSLLTRRRTLDWLSAGHAVAVFPAGGVSTAMRPFTGPALESPWHPFVARLTRISGITIVPVYFHGQNSRLFHLLSHVHYSLRIALLFRETARRIGTTIRVSVGEPVTQNDLARLTARDALLADLRCRTLSLGGKGAPDPREEFRFPSWVDAD